MIRYIKLKNFRSFTNLNFNLTSKNGLPLKCAIIYGENGSGKSNIIKIFDVLYDSFQTMNIKNAIMDILEKHPESDYSERLKYLNSFIDITRIIHENRTISSFENMIIEIGFYLNGKNGSYIIEFDTEQIVHERLEFTLNKNRGLYFDIDKSNFSINPAIFSNFRNDFISLVSKYWGKHSAIAILNYAREDYSRNYFESTVSASLLQLLDYLNSICIYMADTTGKSGVIGDSSILSPDSYTSGELPYSDRKKIKICEQMLNKYFTNMYRDIKKVYYKTERKNKKIKYELYFTRYISGKERSIHYSNESCGTQNLIYLLPYCIASTQGHLVTIDEVDTGIHDILLVNLIKALHKDITGQVIITTHNTFLLNEYDLKDSFFFIEVDEHGDRFIRTPSEFGYRIQPNSNVLLNYLQDRFKGLPWREMEIDFRDISLESLNPK